MAVGMGNRDGTKRYSWPRNTTDPCHSNPTGSIPKEVALKLMEKLKKNKVQITVRRKSTRCNPDLGCQRE